MEECKLCQNIEIERGDTLYKSSSWDGGVGYDYIDNVQYCPLCGRRLLTLKEWMEKKKEEKKAQLEAKEQKKSSFETIGTEVMYHVSCCECGKDWWDEKPFPSKCPFCGTEFMK